MFHGSVSSELEGREEASKRMQRSGFAGFNTEVRLEVANTGADVRRGVLFQANCVKCPDFSFRGRQRHFESPIKLACCPTLEIQVCRFTVRYGFIGKGWVKLCN